MPIWQTTTYRRRDFPGRMTENCWRSVDAHFHDGAGRVLQSVLPIKAANDAFKTDYNLSEAWCPRTHTQKSLTLRWRSFSGWGSAGIAICLPIKRANNAFMTDYNLSEAWFPRTHDQRLLTFHWRSFSWWGREGIAICFGYKGSPKVLYD